MTDPRRPHDVTGLSTPELDRARRDLAVSLALTVPGSPAQVMITKQMSAIAAELAQRPGAGQGTPAAGSPAPVPAATLAGDGPGWDGQPSGQAPPPVTPTEGCPEPSPARPAAGSVLACRICLMPDPPPQQTCTGGHDHHVGFRAGCPACGRLAAACVRRPCSARRG